MSKIRIGLVCLFLAVFWYGCQKETVDVQIDPELQEKWNFSTDDFVSWPDIYNRHISSNNTAKSSSQQLRAANENEADVVNQIFAAEDMQPQIAKISNEIGNPEWSMLMAFKHGSSQEIFELFAPLYANQSLKGILSIVMHDHEIIVRAIKRNSLDQLVDNQVNRDIVLAQIPTISAFNIFDKIEHNSPTPIYEWWYDEVFSEGFTKSSDFNAKCYVYTRTVWTTTRTSSITVTYKEETQTSYVDCIPPKEPQDPFGTSSGENIAPVDITERITSSSPVEKITPIRTYVDLSPFKPTILDENIIDNATTPCVKDLIKKIKDGNFGADLFVKTLREIFDTSAKINITIVETAISEDGNWVMGPGGGFQDIIHFGGTLQINSNIAPNATQDWILSTMIHEMIHAFIDFQKERLARGIITQSEFNRMFPIFNPDREDQNHATMAYLYVDKIADILQRNNTSLSREEALGLSRIGLEDTGFWNINLSQKERNDAFRFYRIGKGEFGSSTSTQINC